MTEFPRIHLGLVSQAISGSGFPLDMQGQEDLELPFHKVGSLAHTDESNYLSVAQNSITRETAAVLGASIIPPESTVLAKIGEAVRLARFAMVNKQCCIDNNMVALVPKLERVMPRFFNYALHTADIEFLMNPGTIPTLNIRALRAFDIPLPDLETQRRIADYLDKEISEMDAMIEEFEGLISSLESRRGVYLQSKFDPAITGDASMKMGTFAQISLGKTFQGEPNEGQDNAFPANYVRAANIQPHGQLVLDEQTMYATQDEVDKYTLNAGDVVIVEGGAGFGRSLTLQEDLPGWIFQNHVIRMVPRSGWLGEYLDYTIRAHLYSGYIELQTVGATIPGLSSERAANLPVAFIPPEEQHKRVTEAREELSRMDALIEESTRLIENLKARKTALITEVVTGRKKV
ncbi:restriction endonuclease subunit S [Corynebacterium sp. HMSC29G08]|uniref:restriction endonuclease subunit S n=1 Tax=Corynebacterium sp. HMSC29G08 TaxID=1581069 RepID=UPI0008A2D274|nr:restriction endonuclease subunit S [Corynebacterium sp. HMSC29G08]